MELITTIAEFRPAREAARGKGSLGLVPTMGYLHEGHVSLVRRARDENGVVAASIFVNPTQFAPTEDLAAYPRNLERDMELLESAGCDLLFCPSADEIYPPPGLDVYVVPGEIATRLEGAERPGHFRGVATVVLKLFNIVGPDRSYFGQKDGQQVAVIRRMARDLNVPGEIIVAPTVREPDGLAMSSRNSYLNQDERRAAAVVYRALLAASHLFDAGQREAETLRKAMTDTIAQEPLVAGIDYASVANAETLQEIEGATSDGAMASIAVRLGPTRLIDNITLTTSSGASQ